MEGKPKWVTIQLKPEDAAIIAEIAEQRGMKKYAVVRFMLRYPHLCKEWGTKWQS